MPPLPWACGAALAIAFGWFWLGLLLIGISRIGDGLDGAVARINGRTDLGGYLDIVLDFVFYGAIPLGFVINDPQANGLAGAALLFAFYANGASFLAYAVMAEKRRLDHRSARPEIAVLHHRPGRGERDHRGLRRLLPVSGLVRRRSPGASRR